MDWLRQEIRDLNEAEERIKQLLSGKITHHEPKTIIICTPQGNNGLLEIFLDALKK